MLSLAQLNCFYVHEICPLCVCVCVCVCVWLLLFVCVSVYVAGCYCLCVRGGGGGVWDLIDVFGVGCGFLSHGFGGGGGSQWGGFPVPNLKKKNNFF